VGKKKTSKGDASQRGKATKKPPQKRDLSTDIELPTSKNPISVLKKAKVLINFMSAFCLILEVACVLLLHTCMISQLCSIFMISNGRNLLTKMPSYQTPPPPQHGDAVRCQKTI